MSGDLFNRVEGLSRRQRVLVQEIMEAARAGRFLYQSSGFWVIIRQGSDDLVRQINVDAVTAVYLNSREAQQVIRANPPRRAREIADRLEQLLQGQSASYTRIR